MTYQESCYCFKCDKEMENIMEEDGLQPIGGLAFITAGHYGSAVFDPMDGSCIEIAICDDCIEYAAQAIHA